MKVRLSKALRIKNALANEIQTLKADILKNNCRNIKSSCPWDVEQLYTQFKEKQHKLQTLKSNIATANVPIYICIYEMDEIKSELDFWKGMNCKSGVEVNGYDDEKTTELVATFNEVARNNKMTTLKERFEELQEQLNALNFNTYIEY